jgi:hypothetical protein
MRRLQYIYALNIKNTLATRWHTIELRWFWGQNLDQDQWLLLDIQHTLNEYLVNVDLAVL